MAPWAAAPYAAPAAGLEPFRAEEKAIDDGSLQGAACVLVGLDGPRPDLLDAVNSAALREHWNWLPGRIEAGAGLIGPLVVPGQSACYRCFLCRREANLATAPEAPGSGGAASAPLAPRIGGLMALETLRLVSGMAAPETYGRVLRMDFHAGRASHRVLRLPNCPTARLAVTAGGGRWRNRQSFRHDSRRHN